MATLNQVKTGDVILFTYTGPYVTNRKPTVIVLHPNYQGYVHALILDILENREKMILDVLLANKKNAYSNVPVVKKVKEQIDEAIAPTSAGGDVTINDPKKFYDMYLRQFVKDYDCYRTYDRDTMSGIVIIRHKSVIDYMDPEGNLPKRWSVVKKGTKNVGPGNLGNKTRK